MASWLINGLDTSGNQVDFQNGSELQLAATLFGEDVTLNNYQDSTHSVLGDQHYCLNVHLNNTKYVSSTQLKINGGSTVVINPTTPVPTHLQVPLVVTFSHTEAVTVTNPSIVAYDPVAPETGAISDMQIYAFEQGNSSHTTWKNINGNPTTFSSRSGSDSYNWYFALSALPIHGEPKTFGLKFALAWA